MLNALDTRRLNLPLPVGVREISTSLRGHHQRHRFQRLGQHTLQRLNQVAYPSQIRLRRSPFWNINRHHIEMYVSIIRLQLRIRRPDFFKRRRKPFLYRLSIPKEIRGHQLLHLLRIDYKVEPRIPLLRYDSSEIMKQPYQKQRGEYSRVNHWPTMRLAR